MTATDWAALYRQLERHEGCALKPYVDTVGKLTIGFGRNLDDKGITRNEAMDLLRNDVLEVMDGLAAKVPCFYTLSSIRRRVLLDMGFNLGVAGLLKFKTTLAKIEAGDYDGAATAMLQSKWAKQVGQRARRLAEMLRTDQEQP